MIDLRKKPIDWLKPKKSSWFSRVKLWWLIIFASFRYWLTGRPNFQFIKQDDAEYAAVKRDNTDEIVRAFKLPAKFQKFGLACFGTQTVFDCIPLEFDRGDVEWTDLNHVTFAGQVYVLACAPTIVLVPVSRNRDSEQEKLFHPEAEECIRFVVLDA